MLPEGIDIRDIIEDDLQDVMQVWEETGMGGSARGDDAAAILNTLNHGGKLWVMTYQSQVIGTSWVTSDGRRLYLHHFGIRPAFHGRGWSKVLLNTTLSWVKQRKMQVKLEVHKNNTVAVNLYKNAGFHYLGDYDVYIMRDVENIKDL